MIEIALAISLLALVVGASSLCLCWALERVEKAIWKTGATNIKTKENHHAD